MDMRYRYGNLFALVVFLSFSAIARAQGFEDSDPQVVGRDGNGVPTFVQGKLGSLGRSDQTAATIPFLREITGRLFEGTGTEEFIVTRKEEDSLGQIHVKTQQRLRGL